MQESGPKKTKLEVGAQNYQNYRGYTYPPVKP